jgi:hypothetical protein
VTAVCSACALWSLGQTGGTVSGGRRNVEDRMASGQSAGERAGRRLLIIGLPMSRNYDALEANRPDIFIGHYGAAEDAFVPARISGMSEDDPRPPLDVKYWAEINLPEGAELRALRVRHIKG